MNNYYPGELVRLDCHMYLLIYLLEDVLNKYHNYILALKKVLYNYF